MYGAILGDIIGSPYEFDANNIKTTEFPLFSGRSEFTDDSIMTCAVAEGLMNCGTDADEEKMRSALVDAMKKYGRRYPFAGYGVNTTAMGTGARCVSRRLSGSARTTCRECSTSRRSRRLCPTTTRKASEAPRRRRRSSSWASTAPPRKI